MSHRRVGPSAHACGPREQSPNHQTDRSRLLAADAAGTARTTGTPLRRYGSCRAAAERERKPLLHASPNTGRERILCAELSPASSSSITDPSTQPAPTITPWPRDTSPPTPALIRTSCLARPPSSLRLARPRIMGPFLLTSQLLYRKREQLPTTPARHAPTAAVIQRTAGMQLTGTQARRRRPPSPHHRHHPRLLRLGWCRRSFRQTQPGSQRTSSTSGSTGY